MFPHVLSVPDLLDAVLKAYFVLYGGRSAQNAVARLSKYFHQGAMFKRWNHWDNVPYRAVSVAGSNTGARCSD